MAMSCAEIFVLLVTALSTVRAATLAGVTDNDSDIPMSAYHHDHEMTVLLKSLVTQYPTLAKLHSIGSTLQGRELLVIQISDNVNTRETGEPRFKYIANMHGNEATGRELLLYLAQYLLSRYGLDDRVTNLVDNTDIYLMPSMNPDGFERSRMGDCDSILGRTNSNGVDLNRDFPDQFDTHRRTKFQPETEAVMNWLQTQPNFVLSANFHGGSLVANYPFDSSKTFYNTGYYSVSPDDSEFRRLALSYSLPHPTMHLGHQCAGLENFPDGITNGAHWYDVKGGMQDYNYLHSNCFEITVEQSCCKYPLANQLRRYWTQHKESMLAFMEQVHTGVKGVIQDDSGAPLYNAKVKVKGIAHTLNTSDRGEFWRLLSPGTYEVSVEATGFQTAVTQIKVRSGPAQTLDLVFDRHTGVGKFI